MKASWKFFHIFLEIIIIEIRFFRRSDRDNVRFQPKTNSKIEFSDSKIKKTFSENYQNWFLDVPERGNGSLPGKATAFYFNCMKWISWGIGNAVVFKVIEYALTLVGVG